MDRRAAHVARLRALGCGGGGGGGGGGGSGGAGGRESGPPLVSGEGGWTPAARREVGVETASGLGHAGGQPVRSGPRAARRECVNRVLRNATAASRAGDARGAGEGGSVPGSLTSGALFYRRRRPLARSSSPKGPRSRCSGLRPPPPPREFRSSRGRRRRPDDALRPSPPALARLTAAAVDAFHASHLDLVDGLVGEKERRSGGRRS